MAACDAVCVTIKWSGKEYSIDKLSPTDTVGYLKEVIKEKTGVLPERQKLLGLKYKGKKKKLVAINICRVELQIEREACVNYKIKCG